MELAGNPGSGVPFIILDLKFSAGSNQAGSQQIA